MKDEDDAIESVEERFARRQDTAKHPGNGETTQRTVFISYFHEDMKAVRPLRDALVTLGERVWWDQDILPGQDGHYEMREALRNASTCIICFSKAAQSRTQSGVFSEVLEAVAMYRLRQPGSIFIIPIRLSDCSIPHIEIDGTRTLDRIQYIDLFPQDIWSESVNRLLVAIRAGRQAPE
jgi:hypothetical protein